MIKATQGSNRLFRLTTETQKPTTEPPIDQMLSSKYIVENTAYFTSPQQLISQVVQSAGHQYIYALGVMIWNPETRVNPQTTFWETHTQGDWGYIAHGFTNQIQHILGAWIESQDWKETPITKDQQVVYYHTFLNNALAPWLGLS